MKEQRNEPLPLGWACGRGRNSPSCRWPRRCLILGRNGRAPRGACGRTRFLLLLRRVLVHELAHCELAQGQGNAIDANFDPRAETLRVDVVVCSELAGALSDCGKC